MIDTRFKVNIKGGFKKGKFMVIQVFNKCINPSESQEWRVVCYNNLFISSYMTIKF